MAFQIRCGGCGTALSVVESLVGRTIPCFACGSDVTVAVPPADPPKPAQPIRAKPLPADDAPTVTMEIPMPAAPPKPASRPRRDEDDEDDAVPIRRATARRKGSMLPLLVVTAVVGLPLAAGLTVLTLWLLNREPELATATTPATRPVTPPTTGPTTSPPTKSTPPTSKPAPPVEPPPPGRMTPATLARLKASTVYLEVDDGRGGGGTGTGWFAVEPGLVVTNAHVIGMKFPGSRPPAKITAFVESGVPGRTREFAGPKVKVLAVDHDKDLAVLQIINEPNLPPPLPVKASAGLNELDKLVVLGFPGGRRMAERNGSKNPPVVSLTETTVSAFLNDAFGNRSAVQLQGGIVHGHSGGPVADYDGSVRAVAARVDLNHNHQLTTIAEAVPAEYVAGLIAGRALRVELGQAYFKGDGVAVPVAVKVSDPLGRLNAVGVGYWLGEKSARPRPPGGKHQDDPGDARYQELALSYSRDRQEATGELVFPKDTDGRAYWVQPYFSNEIQAKQFLAGNPTELPSPPVERVAADLRPRYKPDSKRTVTVTQTVKLTDAHEADGKEVREPRTVTQSLTAEERVEKPRAATAVATLDYTLTAVTPVWKHGDDDREIPKPILDAATAARTAVITLGVGPTGEVTPITQTVPASGVTDAAARDLATKFARQTAATLTRTVVPVPEADSTAAGATWTVPRAHRLLLSPDSLLADPRRKEAPFQETWQLTYVGKRTRAGRTELVLTVAGTLAPVGGSGEGTAGGSTRGTVVLEDGTGVVLEVKLTRTFDLDGVIDGQARRITGTEEFAATRGN